MANPTWLDGFFVGGVTDQFQTAASPLPKQATINFQNGVAGVDNPGAGRTDFAFQTTDRIAYFNVRDYGAKGDGTTNDLPAFIACQAALMATVDSVHHVQGTFFIPPGTYRLIGDFFVLSSATYLGVGSGAPESTTGSIVRFDPGFGLKIWNFSTIPHSSGDGTGCQIKGINFVQTSRLTLPYKGASTAYAVGDIVSCRCFSGVDSDQGNGEYTVYYKCIVAGTTAASTTTDFWTAGCQRTDTSEVWTAATKYKYGAVVRSTDTAHANIFFTFS